MTDRSTLPDGTTLPAAQAGPAIGNTYPLGYYLEDFEYNANSGDLHEHNGRFCVTPGYSKGTYAYFVTIDSSGNAAYPYTIGPTYYGSVTSDIGPKSGHVTIDEPVIAYLPADNGIQNTTLERHRFDLYPNPASDYVYVDYTSTDNQAVLLEIHSTDGKLVMTESLTGPTTFLSLSPLPASSYFLTLHTSKGRTFTKRLVQ